MRYKVGDKVRISKCSVEILKGQIDVIEEVYPHDNSYKLSRFDIRIAESNLRPAEFKIWCETEEEKHEVLEELEKEGYVWGNGGEKPTEWNKVSDAPMCFSVRKGELFQGEWIKGNKPELTPSEFTGIDFSYKSKKIIIEQTKTGATATYGDKTVTTEGDFDEASRQALAEVLCPFKVGDKVRDRRCKSKGIVTKIRISGEVVVHLNDESGDYDMTFKTLELLEPYVEPLYNAKLFCIKGSDVCKEFEEGHIYKIIDGKFNGEGRRYDSLEIINRIFSAQFMEIKGGLDE